MYDIGIFPSVYRYLAFLPYVPFTNFSSLLHKVPIMDANQILDDSERTQKYRERKREGKIEIQVWKRNTWRKQVRKISFPSNDEEGRGNSQRILFSICGYPLHRWSKLTGKTQLVAGDATSPSFVLFMPCRHYTIATLSPVIRVSPCVSKHSKKIRSS